MPRTAAFPVARTDAREPDELAPRPARAWIAAVIAVALVLYQNRHHLRDVLRAHAAGPGVELWKLPGRRALESR